MTESLLNEFIHSERIFTDRYAQLDYWVKNAFIEGAVVEFGVWEGRTLNLLAKTIPGRTVFGFDSFQGLPERWNRTSDKKRYSDKGAFALAALPRVEENVVLVEGWFHESIPRWIEKKGNAISLVHIDCDLYSSARTVLQELNRCIVSGTIIVFDELCDWNDQKIYDLWREGEAKALSDWLLADKREVKVLSRTNWLEGAVLVTK